jgi:uncharacterized protein (TIGR01777 family)
MGNDIPGGLLERYGRSIHTVNVVVSGSSGMIGQRLVTALEAAGDTVIRLVRDESRNNTTECRRWDPASDELDASVIDGCDAVVNLNGRNMGDDRWTPLVKEDLRDSRILPTRTLARAIGECDSPPQVLINASAVGIYGDRGEEELDERSGAGEGFVAELGHEWEAAARAAASQRTRVVMLRMGMVIARGGALGKMLTPFRMGVGGPIGPGTQWWPWVSIEDVIGAIRFTMRKQELSGPVNVVSPRPSRCREFARALGHVLKRPALLPVPGFAARLLFGEMVDELLLSSALVRPAVLETHGFRFRQPDLENAIRLTLE